MLQSQATQVAEPIRLADYESQVGGRVGGWPGRWVHNCGVKLGVWELILTGPIQLADYESQVGASKKGAGEKRFPELLSSSLSS